MSELNPEMVKYLKLIYCPTLDEIYDNVFQVKYDILRACKRLVDIYTYHPNYIDLEINGQHTAQVRLSIRQHQNDVIRKREFDSIVFGCLEKHALGEKEGTNSLGGTEVYKLMQFNSEVMECINDCARPLMNQAGCEFISPPLFYDGDRIHTLQAGKFYGQIKKDWFGHDTLLVRNDGYIKFFAYDSASRIKYMPFLSLHECIFLEPKFTAKRNPNIPNKAMTITDYFSNHGCDFLTLWTELKGYLKIRFNFLPSF